MSRLRKFLFAVSIFVAFGGFLTACGNQDTERPLPTPTSTSTVQPSPTNTKEPTRTPTAINTATRQPTETPEPTNTPTSTSTPTPTSTSTSTLTPTPTPTESPETDVNDTGAGSDFPLPIPSGEPVSEWNGLPVIPQAIAGDGDDGSYSFTVAATADEVQNFYEIEMGKLGWSLLAVGEGETGALLMIFQKGEEVASVSILTLNDNTMFIFLVK